MSEADDHSFLDAYNTTTLLIITWDNFFGLYLILIYNTERVLSHRGILEPVYAVLFIKLSLLS